MKKWIKRIFVYLIISIAIELIFFNFESIRSNFYNPYENELHVYYENNFSQNGNEHILDSDETYSTIEIYEINGVIENIFVDFEIEGNTEVVDIEYYVSDEGNKSLYLLNNNDIVWNNNVLASRYSKINSYGNVNTIVIKIFKEKGETLKINSISLNEKRPFFISKMRIFILLILLFMLSLFFSKDNLLYITFNDLGDKRKYLIVGLIILQIAIGICVGTINKELVDNKYNDQYKMLTDSLISGKTNIDINIDEKLIQMENPYDCSERLNNGVDYMFDAAFYNNKYYVYFGVAPVVVYYLPFKLLTNNYLCDYEVNIMNFIMLSISFILLSNLICKRYFKKIPVLIYTLLCLTIINGCGSLNLLSEPRIYTIPILMALAYSILGLTLWVYSKRENGLNNILVFIGSLSIGIAIASRPQFGLFAFFAIIIFSKEIKDIKNNISSFVMALLPLIVIGVLLMYYNYIRFGNVMDFGANYNLTFNDMTKRGFKLDRILGGIWFYLLQPMSIKGTFPYISETNFSSNYIGLVIKEYSFGGLLFICPITMIALLIFKAKNWFFEKRLYIFSVFCIIFGLIVVIADTSMAGLVERYFSDFSIYFLLVSALVILSYFEKKSLSNNKLYMIVAFMCLCSLSYCFFRLFANTYQTLELCNPRLYYKVLSYFYI